MKKNIDIHELSIARTKNMLERLRSTSLFLFKKSGKVNTFAACIWFRDSKNS